MSLYKLYGTGVTDGLASLDIVEPGVIYAVSWAAYGDLDADGETLGAELSFASASGFTTNDTKSAIDTIRALANDTGTAASNKVVAINKATTGLEIPVEQGERLYLHGTGTALVCTVHIYVRDSAGRRAAGRRVRQ